MHWERSQTDHNETGSTHNAKNLSPRKDYKNTDWNAYKQELTSYPPIRLHNQPTQDIPTATSTCMHRIQTAADNHIPTLTTKAMPLLDRP